MTPTNPEGVPDPAVAGLIEEAKQLVADCTHEDAWDEDAVAIAWRVEHRAVSMVKRLADELERVARQPGREVFVVRGTASPYYDENWVVRAHTTEAAAEADVAFLTAKWAELRPDSVAMKEFDPGFYQYGGDWDVEAVPVVAPPPQPLIPEPPNPTEGVEFIKREGGETFTLSKEARDDPTLSYIINCAFFGRDGETLFNQLPEGGVRVTLDGYCIHPRDKPCPVQAVGVSVEAITKAVHDARTAYYLTVGPRNQSQYIVQAILKLLEAHHAV